MAGGKDKDKDDRPLDDSSSYDSENEGEQIRVSLVLDSSVRDKSLQVPSEPIAVPSAVGRKGLSAVVNHLLDRVVEESDDEDESSEYDESNKGLNFDFVVQNKLLRTGVETAARRYGLSLEQAVRITYFPAEKAPENSGESEPLPDWISALEYKSDHLISGGYNGSISVFSHLSKKDDGDDGLKEVSNIVAHSGPIKCLSAVSKGDDKTMLIATGSLDHTLKTHTWDSSTHELKLHAEYRNGHNASVGSVDIQLGGNLMTSGDWDGGLCLWNYTSVQTETLQEPKRLKTESSSTSKSMAENFVATVSPKVVVQAHASQISGVSWVKSQNSINSSLITGSWDHSIKLWDMERQDCLLTLNGSRVVSCLDTSPHSQVVATGHPDCTVRLWDVRVGGSSRTVENKKDKTASTVTTDTTLKPRHKAWVSCVKWCPNNPYVLASTSHDGTIKIWDIRSPLPLHSLRAFGKEEKGLCLVYGSDGAIYAGGTDCVVKRYFSGNE